MNVVRSFLHKKLKHQTLKQTPPVPNYSKCANELFILRGNICTRRSIVSRGHAWTCTLVPRSCTDLSTGQRSITAAATLPLTITLM